MVTSILLCRRSRLGSGVLITVWLLLSASGAFAQTSDDWYQWGELVKRYDRFSQAGDWQNAAPAADQVAAFTQRRFAARLQYAGLVWQAQSRNGLGAYEEAFNLYEQTYKLCKQLQPQTSQERTIHSICMAESLRGMGIACERLGRIKDAIGYVEQAVAWQLRQNDFTSAAETRSNLASLYLESGDSEAAIREYRQAVATMEPLVANPDSKRVERFILARALTGLAESYLAIGRYDLAEPLTRRSLKIMVSLNGWEHMRTAEILNTMGLILDAQGRSEEAEDYFRNALQLWEATQGPEHHSTAMAMLNLAGVLQYQEKYDEAEALLRRALGIWQKRLGAQHPDTAFAEYNLGSLLSVMGPSRRAEAEQTLQHAAATLTTALGENHPNVARTVLVNAGLQFFAGNYVRASELLERVDKIHEQRPIDEYFLRKVHGLRASLYWATGKKEEALKEGLLAIELGEAVRANASGADRERAAVFEQFGVDFEELINWYAELNRPADVFQTIERRKSRSFLDELRLKRADLLQGLVPAEKERLAKREAELRKQLSEAEQQLDEVTDKNSDGSAEATAHIKQAAAAVMQARYSLYQHLTDVRAASPAYRELITAKNQTPDLTQAQSLLGPDDLMLVYMIGMDKSYVMAIRAGQAQLTELIVSEDIAGNTGLEPGPLAVDSLSKMLLADDGVLQRISTRSSSDSTDVVSKLASLWQLLIPSEEQKALTEGRIKLLTVLPDGPLAMLPFEALVMDNVGEPQYLLDVGPPIAYAPSVAVLMNLAARERRESTAREPVLSLGEPVYQQVAKAPAARPSGPVRAADGFRAGLTPLPYTGWEATWVQQQFSKGGVPVLKLAGAAATEAALRRQSAGREIVHFACHGMADESYGNLFGALAVTPGRKDDPADDGFLLMSEIYELPLAHCELAVLSACHTNFGPQQKGEGTWALSRGFLVAGARRVVASNWVVDDQAGATLVNYFAMYLARAGKDASARDYARSLHEAKKSMRKEEKWSSPFYWANLVLVGPK